MKHPAAFLADEEGLVGSRYSLPHLSLYSLPNQLHFLVTHRSSILYVPLSHLLHAASFTQHDRVIVVPCHYLPVGVVSHNYPNHQISGQARQLATHPRGKGRSNNREEENMLARAREPRSSWSWSWSASRLFHPHRAARQTTQAQAQGGVGSDPVG
jgi:hypothetical protein